MPAMSWLLQPVHSMSAMPHILWKQDNRILFQMSILPRRTRTLQVAVYGVGRVMIMIICVAGDGVRGNKERTSALNATTIVKLHI